MKILTWGQIGAAILGGIDSIYLLVLKFSHNDALCLGSGQCATVNSSPFSLVMGIPVAAIGLAGFIAIIATLLLEKRYRFFESNGSLLTFGMSLVGVLFSAYLTYLEFFVIHAVCPFCVISAVLITLIFILSVIRLARTI